MEKKKKVLKKVLCMGLNVLTKRNDALLGLVRENKRADLEQLCRKHDAAEISIEGFYEILNKSFFEHPMDFANFMRAFSRDVFSINKSVFSKLVTLRSKGVQIIILSDINHIHLTSLVWDYPPIFRLCDDRFLFSCHTKRLQRDPKFFERVVKKFRFLPREAVYVGSHDLHISAAMESGFAKDACFLVKSKASVKELNAFLNEQFPLR